MTEESKDNQPIEVPLAVGAAIANTTVTYPTMLAEVVDLMENARRKAARSVNSIITATYWLVGRQIVEYEQGGSERAKYGESLIKRLSADLTAKLGRGFSQRNLEHMRRFYLVWSIPQTLSAELDASALYQKFPLPWSHYIKLMSVKTDEARAFYEEEALRNGWSIRQLSRQIATQFYERTLLSRNKAAMLESGSRPRPEDAVTPEEEIKDPLLLEFLDLKDEYSESDLEEALIRHIESFLLELGTDFAFLARQRRLRIGDQWFRVDLLFFHRRLRCLIVVELLCDRSHNNSMTTKHRREIW